MADSDEAEARLARVVAEAVRVQVAAALAAERAGPARAPLRVSELFADYKRARFHEDSWRMMATKLGNIVRLLGTEACMDITPARWEKYRQTRRGEIIQKGQSRGKPPAESSLNVELGCAKVMLEWGVEHALLAHNPVRRTRRAKTKNRRMTWLREADLQRLLAAPYPIGKHQRLAFTAWVLSMFDSGARFNEARKLRRDRLRERDEFDDVSGEMTSGWVIDIDKTKNRKAHTIGLTQRNYDALSALVEIEGSPFFLTRPESRRVWGEFTLRTWFRRACELAGVDAVVAEGERQVRPHDGRRSAATNAHNRGASLLEVQQMLNHSSPAITANYVQQNEANAIRMARLMEDGAARERMRRGPKRVSEGKTPTAKSDRTGTA
jgi:site-specific recombinase XerD